MLAPSAVIHAQPLQPFLSKGSREAKGGRLPDRHRDTFASPQSAAAEERSAVARPKEIRDACR